VYQVISIDGNVRGMMTGRRSDRERDHADQLAGDGGADPLIFSAALRTDRPLRAAQLMRAEQKRPVHEEDALRRTVLLTPRRKYGRSATSILYSRRSTDACAGRNSALTVASCRSCDTPVMKPSWSRSPSTRDVMANQSRV